MSPNIHEGKPRFGSGVMELVPLGPEFGVEVRGIGLIDAAISDSVYRSIRAALEEHSVLLFREQEITDDVQAAFSRAFGPLERVKIGSVGAGTFYSRLHNIAADGTPVPETHQQALDRPHQSVVAHR